MMDVGFWSVWSIQPNRLLFISIMCQLLEHIGLVLAHLPVNIQVSFTYIILLVSYLSFHN